MNTIWEAIKVSEHADTAFLLHGSISDAFPPDKQVLVSTFHAAKGLEFRALHLAACDERKSFGNNRRMAFTAVTRAKTALSVYHCDDLHGYFEAALQSQTGAPSANFGRNFWRIASMYDGHVIDGVSWTSSWSQSPWVWLMCEALIILRRFPFVATLSCLYGRSLPPKSFRYHVLQLLPKEVYSTFSLGY